MKKKKFLLVALFVCFVLLVQPNSRNTIWTFLSSQNIFSQLGLGETQFPELFSISENNDEVAAQSQRNEWLDKLKKIEYDGKQVIIVNENHPLFSKSDLVIPKEKDFWEEYANLDWLNRVGEANALLSKSAMPNEERKSIAHVKPSGWKNKKIIFNGKQDYLYNRSHLIGFQLTGQNDNPKNLFTGTRALNANFKDEKSSMLYYENLVANYLRETNHHVRYQIVPIFRGLEKVCRGIWMQAQSIEDDRIQFSVYLLNVQPNYEINYLTGESKKVK